VCLRVPGICHCAECAAAYWADPNPREQRAADELKRLGFDATRPHSDGSMGAAISICVMLESDDAREVRHDILERVDRGLRDWCREFLEIEVRYLNDRNREGETRVEDVRGFPCAWGAANLLREIDSALEDAHLPGIYASRLLAAGA
jgi:hypothetical protein